MKITRDVLVRHFGTIWPVHNRGFSNLLIECRRLVGGDLDQILILSAIGERNLPPDRARDISYPDFVDGKRSAGGLGRINTQSIADSTGIPRETVRRKLQLLIDRGWVERGADGSLVVTQRAILAVASATQATFDSLLDVSQIIICPSSAPRRARRRARLQPDG